MSSNSYSVNFNSESNDYMTVIHLSKSSINVHGSYISNIMHINVFLIVLWFKIYDKRYFYVSSSKMYTFKRAFVL